MKPAELPKRKINPDRAKNPGNWSCSKCHWSNPGIFKRCDNCNQPRKEATPCPKT